MKLAVVGAGYLQLPLVQRARELNHQTICFAWNEGAVCKDVADRFYDVSVVEKERILSNCMEEGIDGIVTIASDVAAPTVAYVAGKMGLPGNGYEAAVRAGNKSLMRRAFAGSGIPCPRFLEVRNADGLSGHDFEYPVVVKPVDRSGSLAVTKVDSAEGLKTAVEAALDSSFSRAAIIESYIEGREVSVEFISHLGKHYPLQVTDKVTTGAPHFVELEHHQPADLPAGMRDLLHSLTARALDALGLTEGASHTEFRISADGTPFIIETGGRMGGDFIGSDLVRLSTGYDFLKGVIDIALGTFEPPVLLAARHSGVYFLSRETARLE